MQNFCVSDVSEIYNLICNLLLNLIEEYLNYLVVSWPLRPSTSNYANSSLLSAFLEGVDDLLLDIGHPFVVPWPPACSFAFYFALKNCTH